MVRHRDLKRGGDLAKSGTLVVRRHGRHHAGPEDLQQVAEWRFFAQDNPRADEILLKRGVLEIFEKMRFPGAKAASDNHAVRLPSRIWPAVPESVTYGKP